MLYLVTKHIARYHGIPAFILKKATDKPLIARYLTWEFEHIAQNEYGDLLPEVEVITITEQQAEVKALAPIKLPTRDVNPGGIAVVSRNDLRARRDLVVKPNVSHQEIYNIAFKMYDWIRENDRYIDLYVDDYAFYLWFIGDFDDDFEVEARMRLP